jgi:hypothetical protein
MVSEIVVGYKIIDKLKGIQIGTDYVIEGKRRARNRADKLDNQYGAYLYYVKPILKAV